MASLGTIQLPPTHKTFFKAKNSFAFAAFTPPVGQKTTSPKGAPKDLSALTPPTMFAGKSLKAS